MQSLTLAEAAVVDAAAHRPMLARTREWSMINSGTGNLDGLSRVAALLADACAGLPGDVRLVEPAPVDIVGTDGKLEARTHGRHLVVSVRPEAPRRVLLTGHMDTVYPLDHAFQDLREVSPGVINGPGVADMKGGLAVMLGALEAFEASTPAPTFGYDVLINSDEETGSASSAALLAGMARGKLAALTYEPSALPDGTLAGARPGSGNFSFVVTGRSAHAGRNPDDGRNAVLAAAALALLLAKARAPGLSVNPARIEGGSPNNVVPDHTVLRVNLRPATPELEADARRAIAAAVAEMAAAHDVGIAVHGGFGRPPKPIDARAEQLFGLVQAAGRDLGQTIGWRATGGVCDGNNIAACGVPVVDTMGVRGGAIHSDQEYLIVESLAERSMLSALTLHRLASGALA